jgi:hypothetical protein
MRPPRDSLLGYWLSEAAPVLPAWAMGLFALATSERIWQTATGPNLNGPAESWTPAWMLIGALVIGSAVYALGPLLGRNLLTVVPSSNSVPIESSSGSVARLGTGIVRVLTVAALHVIVFALAFGG